MHLGTQPLKSFVTTSFPRISDGICLLDPSGMILEANPAYCNLTGYSQTELMKMHISDLEAGDSPVDTAIKYYQPFPRTSNQRFLAKLRTKAGKRVNVEILSLYLEENGRAYRMLFTRSHSR